MFKYVYFWKQEQVEFLEETEGNSSPVKAVRSEENTEDQGTDKKV